MADTDSAGAGLDARAKRGAAGPLGTGETVIVGVREMVPFVASAMPGARIVNPWESDDPIAAMRTEGRAARAMMTFGGFPLTAEMVGALPALEFVAAFGAGFDGVDLDALKARGIALTNAGEANSAEVADYAVAMGLAVRRRVIESHAWVKDGTWERDGRMAVTRTFSGSRAGIVGLGYIGQAIARRLKGFDCEVRWWGPREKPGEPLPRADSLLALAEWCDMLYIACPGGAETRKMIDRAVMDAVGPDGLIATVARGSVIDEDALIAALKEGRLGGAGLDVFEQEPTPAARWRDVPNIVLAPHNAGGSVESLVRMQATMGENYRRFLNGEPLLNQVL